MPPTSFILTPARIGVSDQIVDVVTRTFLVLDADVQFNREIMNHKL